MASNIVDTNGWDTVVGISYQDVNDSIVRQGSSPQHFAQAAGDGSAGVTGDFGQWALTTGGSGADIMMSLPITAGTVTVQGQPYPITPATARILVRANFLPQPDNPTLRRLRLTTEPGLTAGEVASVEDVSPAQPNFLANAALRQLLQDWLNAHLQEFNHTFAVVDFNAEFTREGLEWLRPSHTGYAVAEPAVNPTVENSVFAVLCLIDGKTDTQGLVFQVSPYAIPAGRKAGFVISSEKFLQHMMLAAVPLMFDNIQGKPVTDYFRIDNDGTRIINIKPLNLCRTKLDNGNTVTPSLKERMFSIEVNETELKVSIVQMKAPYSPGITISLNYDGAATLSFDAVKGILDLSVASQAGSGTVEVSQGLITGEIIMAAAGVLLAVVGGIGGRLARTAEPAAVSATEASLGGAEVEAVDAAEVEAATTSCCRAMLLGDTTGMSETAARIFTIVRVAEIGCFLTSALGPLTTSIIQYIANGQYDSLPKIMDLTDNALGRAVVWQGVPGYALASAQLNGALQFGLEYRA